MYKYYNLVFPVIANKIKQAKEKQRLQTDQRNKIIERTYFKIDDTVYIKNEVRLKGDLDPVRLGPYSIVAISQSGLNYQLKDINGLILDKLFMADKLMKVQSRPEDIIGADSHIWDVEKVLDHQIKSNGQLWFKLRWKNFGAESDTWEPVDNIYGENILEDYIKKHPAIKSKYLQWIGKVTFNEKEVYEVIPHKAAEPEDYFDRFGDSSYSLNDELETSNLDEELH